MDADAAREFLRAHHHAVLATTRGDGRPQLSPVLATVDAGGSAVISTRETAKKVRNLRARPEAALCVFTDSFFGDWIQWEGRAEIVSLPAAMPLLVDYYQRTAGEHPDWDGYRDAMVRERRCLVRISLDRAGPTTSG